MDYPRPKSIEVYYDGSCPICSKEINMYKGCKGASKIDWVDVSLIEGNYISPELSKSQALKRLHVKRKDQSIVSGAQAFSALWLELPLFRLLGKVSGIWPLSYILELLYRIFLCRFCGSKFIC